MAAGKTKLIRFESKAQKERIERAAKEVKRSVNQFIMLAVEEKVARMAQAPESHRVVSGLAEAGTQ